ncbi:MULTISPECIES: hypothetical protein [Streptomyces]|uniref:hypothetical protein n=1 Tax=Streptomyces TaxID=1883 RepID=UPI000F557DC3|nr:MULTISPECIES: hypothetical protein [Streptomyces]RPK70677.1 hypothetical protein EES45_35510 [Streptomyces sp. ADI97-07]WRY79949.1 hypothetical protein OG388_01195 [Streptomyces clavifer]WRY86368.1 hypothetical protein OG388_36795 [Streptomyces clavifer]WUC32423.1 hypothetical protein OG927_34230 [Streptomyces clavifer]
MTSLPKRPLTGQLTEAALDTGSLATSLTVGVATAYAAWDTLTSFGDLRIIAAGAVCVITAATAESLLGIVLRPVRRSLWDSTRPVLAAKALPPVAATADECHTQIAAAAAVDAAHRAANMSHIVDHGQLLNHPDRWHGYEDGDATFYLAPGVILHFSYRQDPYSRAEFTLLTSDGDEQLEIRAISDVHRHLTSRPTPEATEPEATAPKATEPKAVAHGATGAAEPMTERPAF